METNLRVLTSSLHRSCHGDIALLKTICPGGGMLLFATALVCDGATKGEAKAKNCLAVTFPDTFWAPPPNQINSTLHALILSLVKGEFDKLQAFISI